MHKNSLKRMGRIANVLAKHGLAYAVHELGLAWHLPFLKRLAVRKKHPPDIPARLRKAMEELGGAFLKLGQFLALRHDLVPKEYCREFSKLLDDVPPMPYSQVKSIVEDSLGRKLETVFPEFEKHPLGSASIAQVHKAKLRTGKNVVVKVQRASAKDLFIADIGIMHWLASRLEHKLGAKTVSPTQIVREFERYTQRELNFMLEARNIDVFHSHFQDSKTVVVPQVFWQYTTEKVITMECLDGTKLSHILSGKSTHDRKALARRIVDAAFSQVLELGVFHADLHPGNILVLKDGRIGLLDFGIVGTADEKLRELGLKLYIALVNKDVEGVMKQLLAVGTPGKDADIADFRLDVERIVTNWHAKTSRGALVTQMMQELFDSAIRHRIQMPADLILLGKALVTAEGTAAALDPHFNFVAWAEPRVSRIIKKQKHPKAIAQRFARSSRKYADVLRRIPEETLEALEQIRKGVTIDIADTDVRHLGMDINTSSNRLAYALVIAALLVSGALLIEVRPRIAGFSAYTLITLAFAAFLLLLLLSSVLRENTLKYDPHRKI